MHGAPPFVGRIIGSIRRKCLNHVILFDERHLRRVLSSYFQYYHKSRTHLSLNVAWSFCADVAAAADVAAVATIAVGGAAGAE